jgi:hypothetical protein
MAQHAQAARIPAMVRRDLGRPGRRGGGVLNEGRKDRLRDQTIIRQGDDEPLGRQGLRRPAVQVARPRIPAPAIEEDQDRMGAGRLGRIKVHLLARVVAIRQVARHATRARIPRAQAVQQAERRKRRRAEGRTGRRHQSQGGREKAPARHLIRSMDLNTPGDADRLNSLRNLSETP